MPVSHIVCDAILNWVFFYCACPVANLPLENSIVLTGVLSRLAKRRRELRKGVNCQVILNIFI